MLDRTKIYLSLTIVTVILAVAGAGIVSLEAAGSVEKNKVPAFTLKDFNGKSHSFSDYKDAKAVAIIFVATQCPISNAYNKRMADLYREFKAKGIPFIGINSNKMEDANEVKEHAQKNGLTFPILKDIDNVVADKFKATVTPEVYVVNTARDILYHGRIDDSHKEDKVTSRDLYNAFTEILAGKAVTVKETKAFGCTIKRITK